MYSGDVVVKRKKMMWHEDLPNARWFLLHLLDVIEIEIQKRECSDKHVACHAACCHELRIRN